MSTYDLLASELREQRALAIQVIERQNELAESLSQQLQDAREESQRKDAEIERLRGALQPFVGHYEQIMADDYRGGSAIVRVKYLKSAWKALQETAGD